MDGCTFTSTSSKDLKRHAKKCTACPHFNLQLALDHRSLLLIVAGAGRVLICPKCKVALNADIAHRHLATHILTFAEGWNPIAKRLKELGLGKLQDLPPLPNSATPFDKLTVDNIQWCLDCSRGFPSDATAAVHQETTSGTHSLIAAKGQRWSSKNEYWRCDEPSVSRPGGNTRLDCAVGKLNLRLEESRLVADNKASTEAGPCSFSDRSEESVELERDGCREDVVELPALETLR